MTLTQMATSLLSQLITWATSHALVVGVAAVAAAVIARALGRAWGLILLAFGTFFATILAVWEYNATGTLLLPAVILAGGILGSGLVGWLLKRIALVGAIGLFAAGWYLVLYAALGSFATASVMDDLALGGLVVLSTLLVHHVVRRVETRRRVPVPYYPEPSSL
jgi:hypothetical protein